MRRTDSRTRASWAAREHDVVVLPTPPLPPQKIHFRDFWSRMFWSVGSRGSKSSDMMCGLVIGIKRERSTTA